MTAAETFGEFAKERRLALGLSLREFCRQNGFDWGNHSRIERGVSSPPKGRDKLAPYAHALEIEEGTDDWDTFFDLAAIAAGNIPERIMNDQQLLDKLPLVFRTIGGEELTPKKLRELAETIRKT